MENFFLTDNPNTSTSATFGWQSPDSALWGLKEGYKDAADHLVNIALEEGRKGNNRVLDTFIFPIMFSYRHSLEISLKLISHRCYGKIPPGSHNLLTLWERVYENIVLLHINNEEFLEKVKSYKTKFIKFSTDDIDFQKIRNIICELQEIDKESDVWRYLMRKNGQLYFTENTYIDYIQLRETMNEIFETLDYLYVVISEYLSG